MSGTLFQAYWAGPPLPPYAQACLLSFLDHGHQVDLYTYDAGLRVPDGVVRRDAAEVVEREAQVDVPGHDFQGGRLAFANLFRFELLHRRGGWWVDTDVVCLSSDPPEVERFFVRQIEDGVTNNAILRFPPGDPVMARAATDCRALFRDHFAGRVQARFCDFGPNLLHRVIGEFGLLDAASPVHLAYEIGWREFEKLLRPDRLAELDERLRNAPFLHLWNELHFKYNFDRSCPPPAGSYLARLLDRHGVAYAPVGGPTYAPERQLALLARLRDAEAGYEARSLELSEADRICRANARELTEQRGELEQLRRRLTEMETSRSWRWTAPLRALLGRSSTSTSK